MILIADSGSTKTDWCLINNGELIDEIKTKGINPFFQTEDEICRTILEGFSKHNKIDKIKSVYFYGAGCLPAKSKIVISALCRAFNLNLKESTVEVNTDMLGAARALCGKESGITSIMGTGSNSCLYNGEKIIENISPLGYILGDEGSGAVLGRIFIGNLLKNQFNDELKDKFLKRYNLTPIDIINKVYKEAFPNRFLASISPFIKEHISIKAVHEMVYESFEDFFKKNIMQYADYKNQNLYFIGSIAYYYSDILHEVSKKYNLNINKICKSPKEGLITYHNSNN